MARRDAAKRQLVRQWKLIELVRASHQGKFIRQLLEALEISRPTLYRDLAILEEAGLPLTRQLTSGEARVKYMGDKAPVPPPTLSTDRTSLTMTPGGPSLASSSIMDGLREALEDLREVRIAYTAPGMPSAISSIVAPVRLRQYHGAPYLCAWAPEFANWCFIKVSRIVEVRLGAYQDERQNVSEPQIDEMLESRLGPPMAVSVRLSATAASFVHERPLETGQTLEPQADGSVIIHSAESTLEEAARWVLGWGQHAEVLAPRTLTERLIRELTAMRNSCLPSGTPPAT